MTRRSRSTFVDLGSSYSCDVSAEEDGRVVAITMTLTAPGCGMGEVLVADVRDKVEDHPDRQARRQSSWCSMNPPWNQSNDVRARGCRRA